MKLLESLRSHLSDILLGTKRNTLAEKSAANLKSVELISDIVATEFLDDDSFLPFHLFLVHRNIHEPVLEDQQRVIDILRIVGRNGQLVNCSVISGISIDTHTILNTT